MQIMGSVQLEVYFIRTALEIDAFLYFSFMKVEKSLVKTVWKVVVAIVA